MSPLEARRLAGLPLTDQPLTERFYPGAVPVREGDRRNSRSRRTKAAMLSWCRSLMIAGQFRPPMGLICEKAGRCIRTGFQQFRGIEDLYLEALQDHSTRASIAARVLGDELVALSPEATERVVRAVVLGKVG